MHKQAIYFVAAGAGFAAGCSSPVAKNVGYLRSAEIAELDQHSLPSDQDVCMFIERSERDRRLICIVGRNPQAVEKMQIILVSEWLVSADNVCGVRDREGSSDYRLTQQARTRATPYFGNPPAANNGTSRVAFTFSCEDSPSIQGPLQFYWQPSWISEIRREYPNLKIGFVNED